MFIETRTVIVPAPNVVFTAQIGDIVRVSAIIRDGGDVTITHEGPIHIVRENFVKTTENDPAKEWEIEPTGEGMVTVNLVIPLRQQGRLLTQTYQFAVGPTKG